jgi:hypothetical protein
VGRKKIKRILAKRRVTKRQGQVDKGETENIKGTLKEKEKPTGNKRGGMPKDQGMLIK